MDVTNLYRGGAGLDARQLARLNIQRLIDGGADIAQPAEESPVPQQPTRTLGFAQPAGDSPAQPADEPGQLDDDTPEQHIEDSRSGQRVRN
jgi:hypothetical protein